MGATSRVVLLATTILVIVAVAGVVTYLVRNSPEPLVGRSPITISAKPLPPVGDSPDPPTASVAKGKVLCLATRQWKELEFEKDWAAVKAAFGGLATKDDKLTAASLGSWLIAGEVVLIHYVGYVDQETGHLMFSEVDRFFRF